MDSFFENNGPFNLNFLLSKIKLKTLEKYQDIKILNISTLEEANFGDISFFENVKYQNTLNKSNAVCVFIKKQHISLLINKKIIPIFSETPLLDFIKVAKIFYPTSIYDDNDLKLGPNYKSFLKKNIIIDESAIIGNGVKIGPNTTIKKNVKIANNVFIGSNCSISNCFVDDNVIINDGSVIGKIGFGFKLIDNKMSFIPHIGSVNIGKSVYIGSNCTIDRGSFSNTVIGDGTMLDNQVHIAHNCKIGKNCFIAGQVGFAGSAVIGNNCLIGGQAGISGHLKIGSNVYIGGGSGVIKDVGNGKKIMGYPAKDFKSFLKMNN